MKTIDSLLLENEVIQKEYKIRRFKKVYKTNQRIFIVKCNKITEFMKDKIAGISYNKQINWPKGIAYLLISAAIFFFLTPFLKELIKEKILNTVVYILLNIASGSFLLTGLLMMNTIERMKIDLIGTPSNKIVISNTLWLYYPWGAFKDLVQFMKDFRN